MGNFSNIWVFAVAALFGSAWVGCIIWERTKEIRSKLARVALVVVGICGLLYASVKDWGGLWDSLTGGDDDSETTLVEDGEGEDESEGSRGSPTQAPELPAWYPLFPVPLSTNGFSWTNIPLDWKAWTFSDPLADDTQLDRNHDGLSDYDAFMLGLDPRGIPSTSGGICSDKFLLDNGLDPFQIWDNVYASNGLTWSTIFLFGWNLDPQDAPDGVRGGSDLAEELLVPAEDFPRPLEEGPPGLGGGDQPAAATDQRSSHVALELGQLLRHGRLRHVVRVGGLGKTPRVHEVTERLHHVQVHKVRFPEKLIGGMIP